jgi:hypothetical protein
MALRQIGEVWRTDNEALARHLEQLAHDIRHAQQPFQGWLFVSVCAGKMHRFDYKVDSTLSAAALVGYAEVATHRLVHHFEDITDCVPVEEFGAPDEEDDDES